VPGAQMCSVVQGWCGHAARAWGGLGGGVVAVGLSSEKEGGSAGTRGKAREGDRRATGGQEDATTASYESFGGLKHHMA
jgi:hypothetical protein